MIFWPFFPFLRGAVLLSAPQILWYLWVYECFRVHSLSKNLPQDCVENKNIWTLIWMLIISEADKCLSHVGIKVFGNKIVVSPIRSTCVSVCLPGRKVVFHLFNRMWGGGPATLFLYWKQCWWKRSIFCNYDHARVYHYNYLVFFNSG